MDLLFLQRVSIFHKTYAEIAILMLRASKTALKHFCKIVKHSHKLCSLPVLPVNPCLQIIIHHPRHNIHPVKLCVHCTSLLSDTGSSVSQSPPLSRKGPSGIYVYMLYIGTELSLYMQNVTNRRENVIKTKRHIRMILCKFSICS